MVRLKDRQKCRECRRFRGFEGFNRQGHCGPCAISLKEYHKHEPKTWYGWKHLRGEA